MNILKPIIKIEQEEYSIQKFINSNIEEIREIEF